MRNNMGDLNNYEDEYVTAATPPEFRKMLEVIFNDEFMQKYTRFENFEGFRYSSAVMTNWEADMMVYQRKVFDHFIKESTDFTTWEEMVKKATDEKFGEQKET